MAIIVANMNILLKNERDVLVTSRKTDFSQSHKTDFSICDLDLGLKGYIGNLNHLHSIGNHCATYDHLRSKMNEEFHLEQ